MNTVTLCPGHRFGGYHYQKPLQRMTTNDNSRRSETDEPGSHGAVMLHPSKASTLAVLANIATGFILSLAVWEYIVGPLYALHVVHSSLSITAIFTAFSCAHQYVWWRYFHGQNSSPLERKP